MLSLYQFVSYDMIYDIPTTIQTEMDFTWKPYRSLKGGVCY